MSLLSVNIVLMVVSYVLGSIPFGLIFSKVFLKTDIRTIGSGNIGATNVLRSGNKKIAIATLLFDAMKGGIPVVIAWKFSAITWMPYAAGVMAVIGHIFPLWLTFKGGKGIATALGAVLCLNIWLGCAMLLTWALVAKIFRISSLSGLVAFCVAPFYALWVPKTTQELLYTMISFVVIILFTHRENLKRLVNRQEVSF